MLTTPDFIRAIEQLKTASKGCTNPQVQNALEALETLTAAFPKGNAVLVDDENAKMTLQKLLKDATERCEQLKKDIAACQVAVETPKKVESSSGGDFLQQFSSNS